MIEIALLRNQVADYRESIDVFEATLGLILHQQTDQLEGDEFVQRVQEVIDGLAVVLERFEGEWQVDHQ